MLISYTVKLTVLNNITNTSVIFNKNFESEITATDNVLYDNYHILHSEVYVLDLFSQEVKDYCDSNEILMDNVVIDEYEIATITDRIEVYFENPVDVNSFTLKPDIKCYVYPKEDPLPVPELKGVAYDSTTIIWSWPEDEQYAHYLFSEPIDMTLESDKAKIIATLPIGAKTYIETGLEPNTPYSRRLINFTDTQTSQMSGEITVTTETVNPKISLDKYFIERQHDWDITDKERETITENLDAFKSGIGDFNDLKVYKQMDKDFYEKFKGYFTLTGKYTQREKRYDQVGFNYKICLEAKETIEEQEGEVTFKLDAYPWQEMYKTEYVWAVKPVTVHAKVYAYVDLFKENLEETTIDKTVEWETTTTIPSQPISIVLSLDLSTSMRQTSVGYGGTRLTKMKKAAKSAVNRIKKIGIEAGVDIEYIIVGYSETSYAEVTTSSDRALEIITSLDAKFIDGHYVGAYTNWYNGLTGANGKGKYDNKMMLLFTDGFPNKDSAGVTYFDVDKITGKVKSNQASIIKHMEDDIKKGLADCDIKGKKIFTIFGCDTNEYDKELITTKKFNESVRDALLSKKSAGDSLVTDGMDTMDAVFEAAIEKLAENKVTEPHSQTIQVTVPAGGMQYKRVLLESETLSFTFNHINTPVIYNDMTKRAEIASALTSTKMGNKSILQLLTAAKESSAEWLDGWKTSETTDSGAIFKNIHIKDTYSYGDEDDVPSFDTYYDYGMMGTVNVNATVRKLSTTDNIDDEYEATNDSYVYISGYTNAIIYDCIRYGHAAVNAYNRPMQTIFYRSDLSYLLKNRVNENITYGSSNINSSYIFKKELALKTRTPNYMQVYNNGIDSDMNVIISEHWQSPTLNYRFNLLDPDAYTPYHEILPASYKDSQDKHVIILTVYYAKNVEINSTSLNNNYYALFDYTNPAKAPLIFSYGLNATWNYQNGIFDCDGHWITQYLHFFARKMKKTQDYYDEIPGPGQDEMYGLVNGRYRESNLSGKMDLVVDTPQFNIPTTVLANHANTIRIYIKITEYYPDSALVSYRWKHEEPVGSGFTKINGDYVTFSSDSLTYKDVDYYETLATYETPLIEMFNQAPLEMIQAITKPTSDREYSNYLLDVITDNGDVLATRYPTEIIFGDTAESAVPVIYRGIVNATSKWSPRIHNGYYYINQHEKFLYSEFNAEANFDKNEETTYEDCTVFLNLDVKLLKSGGATENYNIKKETIAELLQDEDFFVWEKDKGLTLKPVIEGLKYKHYEAHEWISPVILFNNSLTIADILTLNYINTDGSNTGLDLYIRSFDLEEGAWTDWTSFTNGTIPRVPLSNGYQLKTTLSATVTQNEYDTEDYLCCFLDWQEYIDENVSHNVTTVPDHITTDIYSSEGIAVSKILTYACPTGIALSMYASTSKAVMLVAFSNDENDLILENIKWYPVNMVNLQMGYKFYRFKITFPKNEKIYWVNLKVRSLETEAVLPYIKSIQMGGAYSPDDITGQFLKLETFKIPKDGFYHEVVPSIKDFIESEVIKRGFTLNNISSFTIDSTNPDIYLLFDNAILLPNPDVSLFDSAIEAAAAEVTVDTTTNLPFIFTKNNTITIQGTPQQYCPVTVESTSGEPFKQIYNADSEDMKLTEIHTMDKHENYLELKRNDFELETIKVWVNDDEVTDYSIVNHLLMFKNFLNIEDVVTINYNIKNSFMVSINRKLDTTNILVYTDKDTFKLPDEYDEVIDKTTVIKHKKKFKVMFETNKQNNKFVAKGISLNPVYRTDYSGFIYLTEEHNIPHKITIWCNPRRVKAGGADSVDIQIEVLDIIGNPIIAKEVKVDCSNGTIICENYETDMNGVVHLVYQSSHLPGVDIVKAKVLLDDDLTNIQNEIEIISY